THDVHLKVPEFDGKSDADAFIEWLDKVERVFNYKKYGDPKQVTIVESRLTGFALTWWNSVQQARRTSGYRYITEWWKMRRELKERCGKPGYQKRDCPAFAKKDGLVVDGMRESVIANVQRVLLDQEETEMYTTFVRDLCTIGDGQLVGYGSFTFLALIPGLISLQNAEPINHGAGIYAVSVIPFMGSMTGLTSNTLIPHTYNIPTSVQLPSHVRVPLDWVKVNSTKKTIRYHPPEVLKALDQLLLAKEEVTVACRAAWVLFLEEFGKYYAEFQISVQAFAALDCLHSLAILSRNKNYVRPVFVDDNEPMQIHIQSGRHPVLDLILQDNFVPNDTNLDANKECCQIVTGPNMGGKSCYIRQVALIAIMAQVGSFVPASSAKLRVLDGIHTRMGASDNIQQGRSTFLEELTEASHIILNCTAHSLIIIDELGRGTSTHDGVAIAYATLHYLLQQKRCIVLFVTHYPKIVDIKNEFPGSVGAYHVSYLTSQNTLEITDSQSDQGICNLDNGDITFLYKVVPGMSDKSFGLNVARLAQVSDF
ncbi:hypothetical protein GIB67_008012, partial [Kingdonia uniflora]